MERRLAPRRILVFKEHAFLDVILPTGTMTGLNSKLWRHSGFLFDRGSPMPETAAPRRAAAMTMALRRPGRHWAMDLILRFFRAKAPVGPIPARYHPGYYYPVHPPWYYPTAPHRGTIVRRAVPHVPPSTGSTETCTFNSFR